jgi:hypothetical protein
MRKCNGLISEYEKMKVERDEWQDKWTMLFYKYNPTIDREFREKNPDVVKERKIRDCHEIQIELFRMNNEYNLTIGMSGIDEDSKKPIHATVWTEEDMMDKTIIIRGKDLELKNNFEYGT